MPKLAESAGYQQVLAVAAKATTTSTKVEWRWSKMKW
jgi:spore germination protein YaaH